MRKDIQNGTVIESLRGALFRVRLESGKEIMAYLSGKMRINHVTIITGDSVQVEVDPAGGKSTNRIVWRNK